MLWEGRLTRQISQRDKRLQDHITHPFESGEQNQTETELFWRTLETACLVYFTPLKLANLPVLATCNFFCACQGHRYIQFVDIINILHFHIIFSQRISKYFTSNCLYFTMSLWTKLLLFLAWQRERLDYSDKAHLFAWATTLYLHPLCGFPEQQPAAPSRPKANQHWGFGCTSYITQPNGLISIMLFLTGGKL